MSKNTFISVASGDSRWFQNFRNVFALLLVIYRVTEDAIEMHTSTLIYPEHNFQRGTLFKYVDQILPIIDRLPITPSWQCCVWEFLYSYEGKYAYCWRFQYHLKSVYKMICWFARPMGQMTCWPSIQCSKYYFFFVKPFKILCKNPFNLFFLFSYEITKIRNKEFWVP